MAETTTNSQQELQQAAQDLVVLNQMLDVWAQAAGRERMVKIPADQNIAVTPELYAALAQESAYAMEEAKAIATQNGAPMPSVEQTAHELIVRSYVDAIVQAGKINANDTQTLNLALSNASRILQSADSDFDAMVASANAAAQQQTQPQNTQTQSAQTPAAQPVSFTPDAQTQAAMETIRKVLPDLGITPSGNTVESFRTDYTTAMDKIAGMMNLQAATPEAKLQEISAALDKTANDPDFSKVVSGYRFASDARQKAQSDYDKSQSLIDQGIFLAADKAFERVKAGVDFGISKGDDAVLEKVPAPIREDYNKLFTMVENRNTLVGAMQTIQSSGLLNPPQAPVIQTATPAGATVTTPVQPAPSSASAATPAAVTPVAVTTPKEEKPLSPDDPKVLYAMEVVEGKFLSKLSDFTKDLDPSIAGFASKFVDLKPLTEAEIKDEKFEDVQFRQAMMIFRALGGDMNPSGAYSAADRKGMIDAITNPENKKYAAYEMVRQQMLGEGYDEAAVKALRENKDSDLNALFNAMDTLDRAGLTNNEKAKKDRMANRLMIGLSEYLPGGFKDFLKDIFSSGIGKMIAGFLGKAGIQVSLLWGEGRMDDNDLAAKGIEDIRQGYKEEYASIKDEEIPAGKTKLDVMEERVMSKLDSYAVKYVNGALFANASDESIKNAFQASFREARALLETNPKATDEDIMNAFTNRLIHKADELSFGTTGMSLGDRLAKTKEATDAVVRESGFTPPDPNARAELKTEAEPATKTPAQPKITEPTILSQEKGVTTVALSDTLSMTLTFKPNNTAYTQDPLRLSNGRVAAGIQEVFGRNQDKLDLPEQFSPDRMKNAGGRYNDMATQTTCAALEYVFIQAQIHAHYANPATKDKDIEASSIRQQVKTDADIDVVAKYLKAKGVSESDVNAFTKNMNSMAEDMGSVAPGQKNKPTTPVLEQSFLHHQFALDFVKIVPKVEVKVAEEKKPEPPPVEAPKAEPKVVEEIVREAPVTAIPQTEPKQPSMRERIVNEEPPQARPRPAFEAARQNTGSCEGYADAKWDVQVNGEKVCVGPASVGQSAPQGNGGFGNFFLLGDMLRWGAGGVRAVFGDYGGMASAQQHDIDATEARMREQMRDTMGEDGYDPAAASGGRDYNRQQNFGYGSC